MAATRSIESGMAFEALVSGRRRGAMAAFQRAALSVLSGAYRLGVGARNAWYDSGLGVRRLPAPVISVGNITVGGTGKTPMTLWLCRHLLARMRRPAVISRGYKAVGERPADELAMLLRRCPEAVVLSDRDRRRAGLRAIQQCGANAVVLDDGFQHRRVARDLEIVLIDATRPFGYRRLLPRGLLREPIRSLRRADVVIVTRADQIPAEDFRGLRAEVAKAAPGRPVLRAVHRPGGFVSLAGEPAEGPDRSCRLLLFAAIARPTAFEQTVRGMGFAPVMARWYPDHHAYGLCDIAELSLLAREAKADVLVTTEKDAVKLPSLGSAWHCPVLALRVDIDFLDGDGRIIAEAVDKVVGFVEARHAEEESCAG